MQRFGRNTLLRPLFEQAAIHGVERHDILDEIDLDPALVDQVGAFIPSEKLIDAVEFAAIASGRKDFGLHLGSLQDHRLLGPVGILVEHCRSVADAVVEGSRYLHLHNSALVYTLTTEKNRCYFRLQLRARGRYAPTQYVDALLVMFLRFCRLLIAPDWTPVAVMFEHKPVASQKEYQKYFGTADIRFGQPMTAVVARKVDFNRPVKDADPRIKLLIRNLLEDLDRQHAESFPATVTTLLRPLLHTGEATAPKIAKLLSMTTRTLQRRLAQHETTFNEILRQARVQLTQDYLPREGMTVTRLAEILGFAHVSAASRFLRDNFGQTALAMKQRSGSPGRSQRKTSSTRTTRTGVGEVKTMSKP